jgi:hypothetical protein
VGCALNDEMVGGGGGADEVTDTALVTSSLPPGPVQVRLYWYCPAVAMAPVLKPVSEVGCVAAQPSVPVPPVPVQAVALVVDQTSLTALPGGNVWGVAVSEMLGAGTMPTVTG